MQGECWAVGKQGGCWAVGKQHGYWAVGKHQGTTRGGVCGKAQSEVWENWSWLGHPWNFKENRAVGFSDLWTLKCHLEL